MMPPVPALPLPVTWRPPAEPVVSTMMPVEELLDADPDEIVRNVTLLAPIVVLAMFSAVPLVVVSVLTIVVLFCVALTVPPPVALNESFAPVERLSPPVKVMVPLSLLSRLTPVPPVAVTEPVNWTRPGLPVLRLVTSTVRPWWWGWGPGWLRGRGPGR